MTCGPRAPEVFRFLVILRSHGMARSTAASSNRTKSGLRADHSGGRPLERRLDNSLGFFQTSAQVLPLLERWRDQRPKLFDELADVKATLGKGYSQASNPLAAMRDQKAKVAAMLASVAKAVGRDLAAEALRWLRSAQ